MNGEQRTAAADWFAELQRDLCGVLEELEDELVESPRPPGRFVRRTWRRDGGGGGVTAMMKGRVFEKIGVNLSVVDGGLAADFRRSIPGAVESAGRFWAAGLSLVAHPWSPLIPAAHLNTRMISTSRCWFGGGADLTPVFCDQTDTETFHGALAAACNAHGVADYGRFKAWCDEYFFLPHRGETRGVGGIFFDELASGDWNADFAFVRDVGLAFRRVYPELVRRHLHQPWSDDQRHAQLIKRGRYVEFNLLYDRGTTFGLKTGGDVDAILMSLPPEARWP
jgi:coproporphyrinogen III oxidase